MSRAFHVTAESGERLWGVDPGTLNLELSQMQPAAVAAWALSRSDLHGGFRCAQPTLQDLNPDLWLTGIRREETVWRRTQNIVTRSDDGLLRVAPFFNLSEAELEAYMRRHSLPFGDPFHYDPVKAAPHRECGLHQRAAPVLGQ
ncbi:MAG TPA: phosphoadenosine phosphosulfate reductase family protein [Gammaproteobacteria bacterium]|jgi:hypothetical protein